MICRIKFIEICYSTINREIARIRLFRQLKRARRGVMEKILRGEIVWATLLESSNAAQCVGELMPRCPNQIKLIGEGSWIVSPVSCRVKSDRAIKFTSVGGKESPGF